MSGEGVLSLHIECTCSYGKDLFSYNDLIQSSKDSFFWKMTRDLLCLLQAEKKEAYWNMKSHQVCWKYSLMNKEQLYLIQYLLKYPCFKKRARIWLFMEISYFINAYGKDCFISFFSLANYLRQKIICWKHQVVNAAAHMFTLIGT